MKLDLDYFLVGSRRISNTRVRCTLDARNSSNRDESVALANHAKPEYQVLPRGAHDPRTILIHRADG
jgi:hypothetical protein